MMNLKYKTRTEVCDMKNLNESNNCNACVTWCVLSRYSSETRSRKECLSHWRMNIRKVCNKTSDSGSVLVLRFYLLCLDYEQANAMCMMDDHSVVHLWGWMVTDCSAVNFNFSRIFDVLHDLIWRTSLFVWFSTISFQHFPSGECTCTLVLCALSFALNCRWQHSCHRSHSATDHTTPIRPTMVWRSLSAMSQNTHNTMRLACHPEFDGKRQTCSQKFMNMQ